MKRAGDLEPVFRVPVLVVPCYQAAQDPKFLEGLYRSYETDLCGVIDGKPAALQKGPKDPHLAQQMYSPEVGEGEIPGIRQVKVDIAVKGPDAELNHRCLQGMALTGKETLDENKDQSEVEIHLPSCASFPLLFNASVIR